MKYEKAIIGHASIDENGQIAGGEVGDQTGREICTREWYMHKFWLECGTRVHR